MQAAGVCRGQLCFPAARSSNGHAHSSKARTSLLYCAALPARLRCDNLKLQPCHGLLQVSSSMEEHTQQGDAGTKVVKVKFVLQRRCEFGQQFCVTGDEKLLGTWDPEAAIPMQWSEGHIWTVELDLSVGTCMEFKVILMAEQEVIEWQPGPNRKVELAGPSSSLVVFVCWSDEEDDLEKDPQVEVVISEFLKSQNDASSARNLPDLVEDMESETQTSKSVDVTEEQLIEEKSTNIGMVKDNVKAIQDERQIESKETFIEEHEVVDGRTSLYSEVKSSISLASFAIPESWYGEESEQTSEILSSDISTESSPVSLEDVARGETMRLEFKNTSDNMEEENQEKPIPWIRPDEGISEEMVSSMILTTESEPITKDENDEEPRVRDVAVEVTSQKDVEILLADTKLNDINEESSEEPIVQNGPIEVIRETISETLDSTAVTNNQDQSEEEVLADNDLSAPSTEVPEIENPSKAMDLLENVETKPLMTAEKKKRGRKVWSELWGAFLRGHSN